MTTNNDLVQEWSREKYEKHFYSYIYCGMTHAIEIQVKIGADLESDTSGRCASGPIQLIFQYWPSNTDTFRMLLWKP